MRAFRRHSREKYCFSATTYKWNTESLHGGGSCRKAACARGAHLSTHRYPPKVGRKPTNHRFLRLVTSRASNTSASLVRSTHASPFPCFTPSQFAARQSYFSPQEQAGRMVPSLHDAAASTSGVPRWRADRALQTVPSVYARTDRSFFPTLSRLFYDRVFADAAFRRLLFANVTRDDAERNQREYLTQVFGGPALYAARKGETALVGRHGPYPIDGAAKDVWLRYMGEALDRVKEIGLCDADCHAMLWDYFRFTAAYIVEGRKYMNPNRTVGYYGKHTAGSV